VVHYRSIVRPNREAAAIAKPRRAAVCRQPWSDPVVNRQSSAWGGERPRNAGDRARRQSRPPVQEKQLPHSAEAEMGVLSSIMASPQDAIVECVTAGLSTSMFCVPAHRTIFQELRDVWDSGKTIDLITFTQHLRDKGLLESVGGAAAVTELQL